MNTLHVTCTQISICLSVVNLFICLQKWTFDSGFVKITDRISSFLYADCLMDSWVDGGIGWQYAKCIMDVEVIHFWQKETSQPTFSVLSSHIAPF